MKKKAVKRTTKTISNFEPVKVSLAVATLAAVSVVLFAIYGLSLG